MAAAASADTPFVLPAGTGIGLRAAHYHDLLALRPALTFLEVHSENYFGAGGPPHYFLEKMREVYPLSFHGVGLSLGSVDAINTCHLTKLKALIKRYQPRLVSEHLCWTSAGGIHTHDLLPLPYTEEAVSQVAKHIRQTQDFLERRILIENVSSYVEFEASDMTEWEFINAVLETADCDLLLDVNNIYVNATNHDFDAQTYINAMPAKRVQEIHLAGFEYDALADCLVDTHSTSVHAPVWDLYRHALASIGPRPTLIEWDSDLPALDVLLAEAAQANVILEQSAHAKYHAA